METRDYSVNLKATHANAGTFERSPAAIKARERYRANRTAMCEALRTHAQRRRHACKAMSDAYKLAHPCDVCGEADARALGYPANRRVLRHAIDTGVLKTVRAELVKFPLVRCLNCICVQSRALVKVDNREGVNRFWLSVQKAQCGCAFCQYANPDALDFHHADPANKTTEVSRVAKRGSIEQMLAEIAKCIVVCVNCHAKHHGRTR